jgi:hypothetical protein
LAAVSILMLSCSSRGPSGRAERVDVPVEVQIRWREPHTIRCHHETCFFEYDGVATTASEDVVYARHCVVRALGGAGQVLAEGGNEFGIPAGLEVQAGRATHISGTLALDVERSRRTRIRSLDAVCLAYVWQGEVPI